MRGTNVAIPSGAVYPDGLDLTTADPYVQSSVRPEGSYFVKSAGYTTIRVGKNRFQHNKGMGIHFTPQRFAENVDQPNSLPLMVSSTTAADHADIADLPGSEDLDMAGQAEVGNGVLMSEPAVMAHTGDGVMHRGTKTLPDMGDREPHRPLSQMFHGLAHPVQLFKGEYAKDPLIALAGAGLITAIAWSIGRDFERSYRTQERSASSGGGPLAPAAPVAAAPAAGIQTSGSTVEKVADTAVEAVETVAEAAGAIVETAADAVDDVAKTAADAITE